jgi:hypothetical protein
MESFIEHKTVDRFIINMHALHNAHLVRNALPRDLTRPVALFPNRLAKHHELAASLRITKDAQRLLAKEKRDAKKAADELAAAEGDASGSNSRKRKKKLVD